MMTKISYSGYRFPPAIVHQAIWLYARFTLSFRDIEDLLAEREIMVSYETVRRWVSHFGPAIAADLRKRRPKPHSTWHLDEVSSKSMVGWSTAQPGGSCHSTPRPTTPSMFSATLSQQKRTAPSEPLPCRRGVRSPLQLETSGAHRFRGVCHPST